MIEDDLQGPNISFTLKFLFAFVAHEPWTQVSHFVSWARQRRVGQGAAHVGQLTVYC